jgi:hypothetical protein
VTHAARSFRCAGQACPYARYAAQSPRDRQLLQFLDNTAESHCKLGVVFYYR